MFDVSRWFHVAENGGLELKMMAVANRVSLRRPQYCFLRSHEKISADDGAWRRWGESQRNDSPYPSNAEHELRWMIRKEADIQYSRRWSRRAGAESIILRSRGREEFGIFFFATLPVVVVADAEI